MCTFGTPLFHPASMRRLSVKKRISSISFLSFPFLSSPFPRPSLDKKKGRVDVLVPSSVYRSPASSILPWFRFHLDALVLGWYSGFTFCAAGDGEDWVKIKGRAYGHVRGYMFPFFPFLPFLSLCPFLHLGLSVLGGEIGGSRYGQIDR